MPINNNMLKLSNVDLKITISRKGLLALAKLKSQLKSFNILKPFYTFLK